MSFPTLTLYLVNFIFCKLYIYTFIGRNATVAKRGLMILYYFNVKYNSRDFLWFLVKVFHLFYTKISSDLFNILLILPRILLFFQLLILWFFQWSSNFYTSSSYFLRILWFFLILYDYSKNSMILQIFL